MYDPNSGVLQIHRCYFQENRENVCIFFEVHHFCQLQKKLQLVKSKHFKKE
jgi:hypothetical protein